MGQLTLILGGARSGKSTYAEQLAAHISPHVTYIATATASDTEMQTRIQNHRAQRPAHWPTLEIPRQISHHWATHQPETDVVLLDCITLLVSNILLATTPDPDQLDETAAHHAVTDEINNLLTTITNSSAHWLLVSNEVGLGLVPPYPLGRLYRDTLGRANQQLATHAQTVYFMIAGLPMRLQPAPLPPLPAPIPSQRTGEAFSA
ncbi:MAG TPA: bifunctional adenosylcobinamide kinase/adenosylcobinamide-phosphate guanylyltransferase [Anaerolineae bacterium]|nr:bifunctional adenosylcobinamide kinase/adenosylcobinamide-phosphate guanylyltransferase [Anaerolineae bacterium]